MTQTDYLLILASIVIGLALAELLKGVAHILRAGRSARLYWVHGLVALNALLFLLQFWWGMWGWRGFQGWTPAGMLVLVGGVVALYLLSYLVFPDDGAAESFREYYYRHAPALWAMVALYFGVGLLAPVVVLDVPFRLDAAVLQQLAGIAVALTLAGVPRPRVHGVIVPAVTAVNLLVLLA